jgi:outer membrane lipoprotein-sorting protein
MMKQRGAICVLLLAMAWLPVRADLIQQLRERYAAGATLTTEFDLTILWKVREKQESSSGRLFLAPGDKFRVELGPTTWVCDGQTVWQYSSRTKQVLIKRLLDIDLAAHPSQILSRYVSDYEYRVLEDTDKRAILQWEADTGSPPPLYTSITIHYDKAEDAISSLVVIDRHGNESTYLFKKTTFGSEIPRKVFEFEVPKGVEVLDERK